MKTNEFIKKVNELGFSVKENKYLVGKIWLIVCEGELTRLMGVGKNTRLLIDTNFTNFIDLDDDTKEELFNLAVEYAKTPIEDRKDGKRFIIPLPGLVTTDGEQQYLTYKDGKFFASRRDEALIQTWKEDQLDSVLNIYRQCAVEIEIQEVEE